MITGALPTRPNNINALLLALVVAMDACWIYVAASAGHMALFRPLPEIRGVPEPLILAGIEGMALLLSALLTQWERLPLGVARGLLGVGGLGTVGGFLLYSYPPSQGRPLIEWLIIVSYVTTILLIVWGLGSARFSDRVTFTDVYNVFRNGLVIMGVGVLLGSLLGPRGARMLEEMGAVPVWFFLWSLAALGVANRELVREESGGASGGGGIWNLTIGVSMGLVMAVGALTGALTVDSIVQATRGVFVVFVLAVIFPFFIAATVIFSIIAAIFPDVNLTGLLGPAEGVSPSPPVQGTQLVETQRTPLRELPFDVVGVATWVLVALAIVAVLLLASRGLRRARGKRAQRPGQDRESLGSWPLLGRQMRDWLNSLWARARRQEAVSEPVDGLAGLRGRPEWSGTLSVREMYALLQKRAAAIGHPRATHQTPSEYLRTLQTALPDLAPHLVPITSAYIQARYGPLPASGSAVQAATRAWERAEPLLLAAAREQKLK